MATQEQNTWHSLSLEGMKSQADRMSQIAAQILEATPNLGGVTALIMAGDLAHAEVIDGMFQGGELSFASAARMMGSYARFDWVVRQLDAKIVKPSVVYKMLPGLWRGSDPDDTNPRYLRLWRDAWLANSRKFIADSKTRLKSTLRLYRGQDRAQTSVGIAWSLSEVTAAKFAKGAWARQGNRDGIVLRATAKRRDVLGYLTGRNEEEIIIDPSRVTLEH